MGNRNNNRNRNNAITVSLRPGQRVLVVAKRRNRRRNSEY